MEVMTNKVTTALDPASIWPRRIPLRESELATEAQATDMESEGQGQRTPAPGETGSPKDDVATGARQRVP